MLFLTCHLLPAALSSSCWPTFSPIFFSHEVRAVCRLHLSTLPQGILGSALCISQAGGLSSNSYFFSILLIIGRLKTEPFEENCFLDKFLVEVTYLFSFLFYKSEHSKVPGCDLHFGYLVTCVIQKSLGKAAYGTPDESPLKKLPIESLISMRCTGKQRKEGGKSPFSIQCRGRYKAQDCLVRTAGCGKSQCLCKGTGRGMNGE